MVSIDRHKQFISLAVKNGNLNMRFPRYLILYGRLIFKRIRLVLEQSVPRDRFMIFCAYYSGSLLEQYIPVRIKCKGYGLLLEAPLKQLRIYII